MDGSPCSPREKRMEAKIPAKKGEECKLSAATFILFYYCSK
jgi:hypothetical protein